MAYRPVNSAAKHIANSGGVWGSIPGSLKSGSVANAAMRLRSCVAQKQSCGDGPCHLLLASSQYREYDEDGFTGRLTTKLK